MTQVQDVVVGMFGGNWTITKTKGLDEVVVDQTEKRSEKKCSDGEKRAPRTALGPRDRGFHSRFLARPRSHGHPRGFGGVLFSVGSASLRPYATEKRRKKPART